VSKRFVVYVLPGKRLRIVQQYGFNSLDYLIQRRRWRFGRWAGVRGAFTRFSEARRVAEEMEREAKT
jgi:hypothetical protein